MFPDPTTGEPTGGIAKVRYSHDAMIDLLIAEPTIKQGQLAEIFGRTQGWISQVINSDAFQARLAERKAELVDPVIVATIKDRISAVAGRSLELILQRLNSPTYELGMGSEDFMLKAAKLSTEAMGYGARAHQSNNTTQVAVVIQVPPKITNPHEWVSAHSPT